MIAWASPPCHTCGEPVQRVEIKWLWRTMADAPVWRPHGTMVCMVGHRVPVQTDT
jgi:hypothetical protein